MLRMQTVRTCLLKSTLRLRSRKVPDKYGRRQSALWYLSPDKKRYAVCFPAPLQSAGPVTMPRYGVPGGVLPPGTFYFRITHYCYSNR